MFNANIDRLMKICDDRIAQICYIPEDVTTYGMSHLASVKAYMEPPDEWASRVLADIHQARRR